jgi:hypothetical protein
MKKKYFMPFVLIVLIGVLWLTFAVGTLGAEEVKVTVPPADLPPIIQKAVETIFPDGQLVEIQKELAGENLVQYDAVIRLGWQVFDVEISPEGAILEIKGQKNAGDLPPQKSEKEWTRSFGIENRTFTSTGRNPYFILEPGYQLIFKNATDKLVITVLEDTKTVNGIETRVVEEREWEDDQLAEVSRNFFAVCDRTNDVFYFGEEVDDYKDGKIVGHGGAWLAGQNGASAGIIMPGSFLLGARYYQEIAPDVAMDRAENAQMGLTVDTPAGQLKNCVKVIETSPMEGGESIKLYAPGIGLIADEDLKLVEVKKAGSK